MHRDAVPAPPARYPVSPARMPGMHLPEQAAAPLLRFRKYDYFYCIMVKNILSVLTGLVVAFAVMYAPEIAAHRICPVPEHISYKDRQAMAAMPAALPAGILYLPFAYPGHRWHTAGWPGLIIHTKTFV